MRTFANEKELRDFLIKVNPVYGAYASILFQAGTNDPSYIGTADVADLMSLIIPKLHAINLIAKCKATGTTSFPPYLISLHTGFMESPQAYNKLSRKALAWSGLSSACFPSNFD